MKNIVSQALVTMGYRKVEENIFMKPIGFAILVAKILYPDSGELQVEIKLGFNKSPNGEFAVWNRAVFIWPSCDIKTTKVTHNMTEEKIYNETCIEIAHAEAYIGLQHANMHNNYQTFAFKTPNDINQLINL